MQIAGHEIGNGAPVFVIAEIGINHNGSVQTALDLIDAAQAAGADAVKFQKRTPELCVPRDQWDIERDTIFGRMRYIDYKKRMELSAADYYAIDYLCKVRGMTWFASAWDVPSVDFLERFDPPCYKVASASITDTALLQTIRDIDKPVILSTGMSTLSEVDRAFDVFGGDNLALLHCRATYPAALDELNLRMIQTLRNRYNVPIGYSGHETGLAPTLAAVALGACIVERHITLDRTMQGTDHAASVEPQGFARLVKDIRAIEKAMGDGQRRKYASEQPYINKLRGATNGNSSTHSRARGQQEHPAQESDASGGTPVTELQY